MAAGSSPEPMQGVGPYSDLNYRNGSDIESDNYTAAREAEQQMLASNRTALNAANVTADPSYYSGPTPEQSQAMFRKSERDYRQANDASVAGSAYRARAGDSISRIVGSSDPQAIGNFMRANNLTSDHIDIGRNYFRPDSTTAYGDASDLGQFALNQGNERIAAANRSEMQRELNRFAAMTPPADAEPVWSFREASMAQRKLDDARALAEYQARLASQPMQYIGPVDVAAQRAAEVRRESLLNFLNGQGNMALGGVVSAGVMIGTRDVVAASAATDAMEPLDNLLAPMGGGRTARTSASGPRRNSLLGGSPAADATSYAQYKESLTRLEFAEQASWKPASSQGDQLLNHAYNRHPSLATTEDGLISPTLYDQRARANIVNMNSEVHSLGGTKYAAFNQTTGEMTVFSFEGGGGLPAGGPTIHSYYIPLRNELTKGVPFNSQGQVNLRDIWSR